MLADLVMFVYYAIGTAFPLGLMVAILLHLPHHRR